MKPLNGILVILIFMGMLAYLLFITLTDDNRATDGLVVPTIAEIQEMVGAKPDGIMGPETIKKWEQVTIDQEASKHDHLYTEASK